MVLVEAIDRAETCGEISGAETIQREVEAEVENAAALQAGGIMHTPKEPSSQARQHHRNRTSSRIMRSEMVQVEERRLLMRKLLLLLLLEMLRPHH